ILNIRVIPKASRNLIKKDKSSLKAYLTQPAHNGLANKQLIELLASHLKVKKYQIKIIKGEKLRDKVIEIDATAGAVQI
ncbi:MAG: DUF167 domain-containing protein, partial [Candidatus Omnitrophota bacterium]|nr:DUF167 domain-containing protein [Candidatus Omnitrophota bacterium]